MSVGSRLSRRYRMARAQAPGLRLRFALVPVHRRAPLLLRRRLHALGVHNAGAYLRELEASGLEARLEARLDEYYALAPDYSPGEIEPLAGALLYALVRALRPETVIETGTANGVSTSYFLAALDRNGAGRLLSIDLPFAVGDGTEYRPLVPGSTIGQWDASPLPPGKEPGWLVPDELRGRWELRLGDARELLPAAVAEAGSLGIFFHDSLHTREHMLFEFEIAWPALGPGGLLLADDVFQRRHDAVPAFARSVGRPFSTYGNLGIVVK